jgi:hypothetical protein
MHIFTLEDLQIYLFKTSQHQKYFSMEVLELIFLEVGQVHQIYYYKVMVFNNSNSKKKA